MRRETSYLLDAMDWPQGAEPAAAKGSAMPAEDGSGPAAERAQQRPAWRQQLATFGAAFADWMERFWQVRKPCAAEQVERCSAYRSRESPLHACAQQLLDLDRCDITGPRAVYLGSNTLLCLQDWGMEVAMGALLVAAFLAQNLLSLLYMALIAVGMVSMTRRRQALFTGLLCSACCKDFAHPPSE